MNTSVAYSVPNKKRHIIQSIIKKLTYETIVDDVMKKFLYYLSTGDFRIPVCDNCGKKVWPPCNICSNCFSKKIRMSKLDSKGRLIEYTQSFIGERKNLGLVEISGIRIIGSLSQGNMSPGSPVKLTRCGLDKDNSPYYEFSFT